MSPLLCRSNSAVLRHASSDKALTKVFANGDSYAGGWKDGLPHGEGRYTWADGSVYEGVWKVGAVFWATRFVFWAIQSGSRSFCCVKAYHVSELLITAFSKTTFCFSCRTSGLISRLAKLGVRPLGCDTDGLQGRRRDVQLAKRSSVPRRVAGWLYAWSRHF